MFYLKYIFNNNGLAIFSCFKLEYYLYYIIIIILLFNITF